ncbi:hypothetical protein OPT61_g10021 [Boeremia exigua]|uniref:Uncharacterized protein n=1 Tax=Boeremia exigua TaxID=749465 RepID=A0ACC2HS97_9PLEO|nr:hypothetical protein OPT61_g10021 [Boeremia exigua]
MPTAPSLQNRGILSRKPDDGGAFPDFDSWLLFTFLGSGCLKLEVPIEMCANVYGGRLRGRENEEVTFWGFFVDDDTDWGLALELGALEQAASLTDKSVCTCTYDLRISLTSHRTLSTSPLYHASSTTAHWSDIFFPINISAACMDTQRANVRLDNGRPNERIRRNGSSSAVAPSIHCFNLAEQFYRIAKQPANPHNMASAPPKTTPAPTAPTMLASTGLSHFRDHEDRNSDASDSDQSLASGRSLSPTRQGLSKTKKRKERRQFGAFADELGDLLGAAFQSKSDTASTGLTASTHAESTMADGDSEMQVQPTSSGPKMSKRQRQNLARMEARRLAKEQSKMITSEPVAAERKGMTINRKPLGKTSGKSESQKRRSRKERERFKKRAVQAGAMDID